MLFKKTADPLKDLADLDNRIATLSADVLTTQGAIATMEADAIDAVVDGTDGNFAGIGAAKSKLTAMQNAIGALRAERPKIENRVEARRAATLRAQAAAKRAEAAAIVPLRNKLLGQLSELEGLIYDASILSNQRCGTWNADNRFCDPRLPAELRDGFELGSPDSGLNPSLAVGQFARSKERVLFEQACALIDEAERIETKLENEGVPVEAG